ncbi:hypothetical protein U9M48_036636 [Paspalum notatum var. saurae]|uniref:Scarecrow-like protein 9 n=1 Tax=Paspalum notatum var. saurae TaxID=547442 RepID=A0AAQ3XBC8_PASNO
MPTGMMSWRSRRAGRNRKLMAPEPEEAGDMVDKMVVDGYDMWMEKMKDLRITRTSEATTRRRKQSSTTEAAAAVVDLRALLIRCAHAVSMDDHRAGEVDDLRTDPDEVLIVNGITEFGSLMDDGGCRDAVLSNIRKMRPDVFILCVANGSYGTTPFFVTRFKEALSHYSAMSDMMAATATSGSDQSQRLVVERDLMGRCALNAIACEGSDRVERHETYKQWQAWNHRAGLRQLPLHPDIVAKLKRKVGKYYHKDFVVDVDQQWLLQAWKGRILFAMSAWDADDDAAL